MVRDFPQYFCDWEISVTDIDAKIYDTTTPLFHLQTIAASLHTNIERKILQL